MPGDEPEYDAFLSYAMRSDYARARRLEAFLESIVARVGVKDVKALRICRDGSDFRLPARQETSAQQDEVERTIDHYLERSRKLVVLCSRASIESPWVDHEVRWFVDHDKPDDVLLAVTEGADPAGTPETVFPKAVLNAGLHHRIWYDLRGKRSARTSGGLRDEDDERIRLAAELLNWDETRHGPLLAVWQREEIRRKRVQTWIALAVAVVVIVLAAIAFSQRQTALQRLADVTLTSARLLTYSGRFNEAHALLAEQQIDDPRLAISAWLIEQQRSYSTKAAHPLVGVLVREAALDHSGQTIAAVSWEKPGQSHVIAVDARTMKRVGAAADLPDDVRSICDVRGRANEFLFVGSRTITHGTFAEQWRLNTIELPRELRSAMLFAGGERGLAIRGSAIVRIRREREVVVVENEIGGTVGAAQFLIPSPDGTMLGLAESLFDENVFGVARIARVFDARSGTIRELPLDGPVDGRLLGNEFVAALEKNDTLSITRLTDGLAGRTREIFYKPWLGFVAAWQDMLLVQEVGDVDRRAVAKISFLDAATGRDVIEGCTVQEPIAGFGIDSRGRLSFVSQSSGIVTIDTAAPRARVRIFEESLQPPLRVHGQELLFRTGDALSGTLWAMDVRSLTARAVTRDEVLSFDLARDGTILTGTMHGLRAQRIVAERWINDLSVSPDGDRALVADAEQLILIDLTSGKVIRAFGAKTTLYPVTSMRWLTSDEVLIEDFHGGASILDVRTGQDRELPLGNERITAISPRGECLITAQSGIVRRLAPAGTLEEIAHIRDLRSFFPLEQQVYVGQAEQPPRLAFFRMTDGHIEEVGALPTSDPLRDALVVDGKVVLVLSRSIVVYPLPLPR